MESFLRFMFDFRFIGWNQMTLVLCGLLIASFWEIFGAAQQVLKIWRGMRAQTIALERYNYSLWAFAGFTVYGWEVQSPIMVFNGGTMSLLHVPIVLGVCCFGDVKWSDLIWTIAYVFLFALIVVAPGPLTLGIIFAVGIVSLIIQILKLKEEKDVGDLTVGIYKGYVCSDIFWLWYGILIGDLFLILAMPVQMFALGVLIYYYYEFF